MERPRSRERQAAAPRAETKGPGGTTGAWLEGRWKRVVVLGAIVAFAAIVYVPTVNAPFIGDDYVFLDKTRDAPFSALWSFRNTDFGWYRPWSRELHFWTLQHLFGPREPGFRLTSLALWLAILAVYFALLRRIAGERVAALATLGAASLALWGASLTWISGVQDLWMLLFAMLTLFLVATGRDRWAWLTCAGALLSKETAAMLPPIVLAQLVWIDRLDLRASARRVAPFVLLTGLWLAVHPTLLHRVSRPVQAVPNGERPKPAPIVIGESLLSLVNSDRLADPVDPEAARPLAAGVAALLLAGAAWFALRRERGGDSARHGTAASAQPVLNGALLRYGAAWCAAGWLPLLVRSIGWHAYYGSLGVMGAWLAIAGLLVAWPRTAAIIVLALGLLRGRAEATRSWDWGSQWYQTRAGNMLRMIHDQLLTFHPALPAHTRLYFGNIPNNIGLIAGKSPAVRVWYDDPTLEAGFYSYYRARTASEPKGVDLFFHFDSTSGIREVSADGAGGGESAESREDWERDHESLAVTLLANGDLPRAARLFEAIARLPNRPDALMFAAVAWQASGDSAAAERDLSRARERTGMKPEEIERWAARLRVTLPHDTPTVPN